MLIFSMPLYVPLRVVSIPPTKPTAAAGDPLPVPYGPGPKLFKAYTLTLYVVPLVRPVRVNGEVDPVVESPAVVVA
jgi:hypothetical protein